MTNITEAWPGEVIYFFTDANNHYQVSLENGKLVVVSTNLVYGPTPINVTSPKPHVMKFEQVKRDKGRLR